jgi:manganese/zinc/iron transport system permease protein
MELFKTVVYLMTQQYTVCVVMLGVLLLGATCGLVGTLIFLRGGSLCADALSHAALPGVVSMFILTCTKHSYLLLLGGILSSSIAMMFIVLVRRYTKLKMDTVLGMVLSVFFGAGLVLMTVAQKLSLTHQCALHKYIFGMAATLLPYDIALIALVSAGITGMILLFWKELRLIIFDADYAKTRGYALVFYDTLLLFSLILLVSLGLHAVGVIVMSALLLAPAVTARQITQQMTPMALYASFFGAVASIVGTSISCSIPNLATGPVIVVVITGFVCVSCWMTPLRVV